MHVSDGFATYIREENNKFELAPEETKNISWKVTPEDAAFGKFILVKVYRFQIHPLPSYQATCGIFVLDVAGFTGAQLTWAGLAISLVGMIGGASAFSLINKPLKGMRKSISSAMIVFGIILLIGFALSYFLGSWLLGTVSLVALLLILLGCIAQLLK